MAEYDVGTTDLPAEKLSAMFTVMRNHHYSTDLLSKLKFVKILQNGEVHAEIEVDSSMLNPGGTFHGGAQATLADELTTYSVIAADKHGRPGSSIDMSITCYKAIPLGARTTVVSRLIRLGRTLAFCDCSFYSQDGELLSHFKQTKFILAFQKKSNL